MCVHLSARVLDDIQRKLIDKQGRKSITNEVKIRNFLNNIPDIIKNTITPHLTDYMTYNDIVTKSQPFEAANRVANAEPNKTEY